MGAWEKVKDLSNFFFINTLNTDGEEASHANRKGRNRWIIGSLVALFAIILLRNTWLCDDSYITLRTVDNFVHGYGLTWNVVERVQSYTHPLWMFVLSLFYAITREAYFTTIFVSMFLSVAAVFLFGYRLAVSTWTAALGISVLMVSKAFIDFSASGLENPLTNVILVVFFIVFMRSALTVRTMFWLSLLASAAALSRLDSAILLAPPILYALWKLRNRRALYALILGGAPLILWELFSLFYYGFPFPNTAYAKLNTSIEFWDLARQGIVYIRDSIDMSPVTPVTIGLALIAGLVSRRPRLIAAAVGILLCILYVIKVGGDFMTGRFLVAPMLVSVTLLSQFRLSWFFRVVGAAVVLLGVTSPLTPVFSGSDFGTGKEAKYWNKGIGDERAGTFKYTGLFNGASGLNIDDHPWRIKAREDFEAGETIVARAGIGIYGYYAGPSIYILDRHALSDALLARLPVWTPKRWRPGHFTRVIPEGYFETLKTGTNSIADPDLAMFYDRMRLILRGSLLSGGRLKDIVRMNLGSFDGLLAAYTARPMIKLKYEDVRQPVPEGTPAASNACVLLPPSGIEIDFGQTRHAKYLEIGLDHDNDYTLEYFNTDDRTAVQSLKVSWLKGSGIRNSLVSVPQSAGSVGFDRLRVKGVGGDGVYAFSHVALYDAETDEMCRQKLQEMAGLQTALSRDDNLVQSSWSYNGIVELLGLYPIAYSDSIRFLFCYRLTGELNDKYKVFFHVVAGDTAQTFQNYDFLPPIPTNEWDPAALVTCQRVVPNPGVAFRITTGLFKGNERLGQPFDTSYDPSQGRADRF